MNTQDFKVNSLESDEYDPLPKKPEPITALESDEYDIPKAAGKRVVFKRNKFSKEEAEVLLTALAMSRAPLMIEEEEELYNTITRKLNSLL
tara:strand:- start:1908 stop:2180 length:273 start_codon:yes stop_codon:yes gene_type:complete